MFWKDSQNQSYKVFKRYVVLWKWKHVTKCWDQLFIKICFIKQNRCELLNKQLKNLHKSNDRIFLLLDNFSSWGCISCFHNLINLIKIFQNVSGNYQRTYIIVLCKKNQHFIYLNLNSHVVWNCTNDDSNEWTN